MTLAPFHIPDPIEITLDLPFPPSVNRLWTIDRHGRRIICSKEYQAWIKRADLHLIMRRTMPRAQIHGPCEVRIVLNCEAGFGDADNRIKALLDYAQRIEVVDNDRLIVRGHWEWGKPIAAPDGARMVFCELAG